MAAKDNRKILAKFPSGRYALFPFREGLEEVLKSKQCTDVRIVRPPSLKTLERWMDDGICQTPVCGCRVEPDGGCTHGRPSWMMLLGYI